MRTALCRHSSTPGLYKHLQALHTHCIALLTPATDLTLIPFLNPVDRDVRSAAFQLIRCVLHDQSGRFIKGKKMVIRLMEGR